MIFLDVNILLELLLERAKLEKVTELLFSGDDYCISFLSVHLIYHFAKKEGLSFEIIDKFLLDFGILNCDQQAYDLAKKIRQDNDFEDALQVATLCRIK